MANARADANRDEDATRAAIAGLNEMLASGTIPGLDDDDRIWPLLITAEALTADGGVAKQSYLWMRRAIDQGTPAPAHITDGITSGVISVATADDVGMRHVYLTVQGTAAQPGTELAERTPAWETTALGLASGDGQSWTVVRARGRDEKGWWAQAGPELETTLAREIGGQFTDRWAERARARSPTERP